MTLHTAALLQNADAGWFLLLGLYEGALHKQLLWLLGMRRHACLPAQQLFVKWSSYLPLQQGKPMGLQLARVAEITRLFCIQATCYADCACASTG